MAFQHSQYKMGTVFFVSQVTFVPGLEGLKNRIEASRKSKESKQAETVWDTYMRRKKEKAKMRKVSILEG